MSEGTALTIQQESGLMNQDEVLVPVMSLALAKQRLNQFQEFVRDYLKEGEDFGIIPGTPKPTLYKPGADKLCELYGLGDSYEIMDKVEDFDRGLFDYTIRCTLTRLRTGLAISTGLGSCNSYEGRYRWREGKRVCPRCGNESIIKGKEEYGGGWLCYGKKGGCGAKFSDGDSEIVGQTVGKVENDDVATLKNTILKMAKKRAKVDATLAATRSSGIFTQDIEDISGQEPDAPAQKQRSAPKVAQRKPVVENVTCASCGKTNGHDPSCKYAQPKPQAVPPSPSGASSAQSAPPPTAPQAPGQADGLVPVIIRTVEKKERKDKTGKVIGSYYAINVLTNAGEDTLFCFHLTIGSELQDKGVGKACLLKIVKIIKGDRTFYQVEDLLEIAGVRYQDGKPVIPASAQAAEEPW